MWFVGGVSCKPMQRAGLVKRKVWRRWATTPVRAGGKVGSAQKKGGTRILTVRESPFSTIGVVLGTRNI
jgi:hypothetical protein